MKDLLTQKIADAVAAQPSPLTRREVRHPAVRGKAPQLIQVSLDISTPSTRERENGPSRVLLLNSRMQRRSW